MIRPDAPPPSKTADIPRDIRAGTEEDYHFIVATWTTSLKGIYPNRHAIDFFAKKMPDIRSHVERANTLVAYVAEEPDDILSYLVFLRRGNLVIAHFSYTKDLARRQGHLSALLELANPSGLPLTFTQPARNENVMRHLCRKYIFDPSLWGET